jgi:1-acyl-sn-glycerol-3-phosphate acyltransferase
MCGLVTNSWVWNSPFFGWIVKYADFHHAADGYEALAERVQERVNEGYSVIVFPEGTRSKDGQIHNFKAGAFILAKDAEVPILPIVLDGTNTMIRKGWLINWSNKITIKVLPPIPAEEVRSRDIKDVMAQVRIIREMSDWLAVNHYKIAMST